MIVKIFLWSALVTLTVLPLLSTRRGMRILSIAILLFAAHSLLWSGLWNAARNVDLPDPATLSSQTIYADAWHEGRIATQAQANHYVIPLGALFVSLAILALSPVFKRKSQLHTEPISGTSGDRGKGGQTLLSALFNV